MQPQQTTTIPAVVTPSTTLATSPAPLPVGLANTDIGKQFASVLDDMKTSVSGVRDAATAQSALPRMQDAAGRLDKVSALAAQLPPEQRRLLATYVGAQQGWIKSLIGAALAMPSVGGILRPVLEQMQSRLDGLAKA